MRVLLSQLVAFFVLICLSTSVFASTGETNALLDAWQMEEANEAITALEKQYPDEPDVQFLRGKYLFFQGDYQGAIKKLEKATSASARPGWRTLLALVQSTAKVTAKYKKFTSPSKKFDVYLPPGSDEVILPYAFEGLDAAYEAFVEEFNYAPPTPIRVEVYPATAVLAQVSSLTDAEIRTSGTIALCKYNRLMITSPKALLRGYGWVDTLVHEYVHFVVNKKSRNGVPIWMHEGLAKYLERRWRGPDEHRLPHSTEQLLQKRVAKNDLVSFAQMHPSMAKLPSQEDAAMAFAEVFVAMEYLKKKAGKNAFGQLLEKISTGTVATDAFGEVLGVSFAQFEKDWKKYLKTRPKVKADKTEYKEKLVFKDDAKSKLDLGGFSPKTKDFIHLGELMHARKRFAAAAVEYEKAVAITGATNPVLQTRLAECYLRLRRPKDAEEALTEVVKRAPSYVQTWIKMGWAFSDQKEWAKAEPYLVEAARINPFDPEVHNRLAVVYDKLGKKQRANQARRAQELLK